MKKDEGISYKIDNDIERKDNQIQNLNEQILLRDNCLKEIKQKLGNNVSYNIKRIKYIEELNMEPCVDSYSMIKAISQLVMITIEVFTYQV